MEDIIIKDSTASVGGYPKYFIGVIRATDLQKTFGNVQPGIVGLDNCNKVIELLRDERLDHLLILGGPAVSVGDRMYSMAIIYRDYIASQLKELSSSWRTLELGMTCVSGDGLLGRDFLKADDDLWKITNELSRQSDNTEIVYSFIGDKSDYAQAQKAIRPMISISNLAFIPSGKYKELRPALGIIFYLKGCLARFLDPTCQKYPWMSQWAKREVKRQKEALKTFLIR